MFYAGYAGPLTILVGMVEQKHDHDRGQPMIEVRDAASSDWPLWRRMWVANCAHFRTTMPDANVHELWRRILNPEHPVCALVSTAPNGRDLLGFAHYVLHPHTFSGRMVCYLEDLWVDPAGRGTGIGRRFVDSLIDRGRDRGWRRIYWHTEADNEAARRLYDQVATLTKYVRHDVALP
jgi:GNAT superfamily N-acetyltransferase